METVPRLKQEVELPLLPATLWRKYGRKDMPENRIRHYYRCNVVDGCRAKRQRTLSKEDGLFDDEDIGAHSSECMSTAELHVAYALLQLASCGTNV